MPLDVSTILRSINDVADDLGLLPDEYATYGRHAAKIELTALDRRRDLTDGRLICVTAVTPTKAGEGKTTTSISLTDGLGTIGERAVLCLREPSLGPVFGIKGGGTGGGREAHLRHGDHADQGGRGEDDDFCLPHAGSRSHRPQVGALPA